MNGAEIAAPADEKARLRAKAIQAAFLDVHIALQEMQRDPEDAAKRVTFKLRADRLLSTLREPHGT